MIRESGILKGLPWELRQLEQWTHKKTDIIYFKIGEGLCTTNKFADDNIIIVFYQDVKGNKYCREKQEFEEKFERSVERCYHQKQVQR